MEKVDVIIIGAGAAGLMCAIEAGKRGRNVIVLEHANKAGKKILMSGGVVAISLIIISILQIISLIIRIFVNLL